MDTPISDNINQLFHLSLEEKTHLQEQLVEIHELSQHYKHDYEHEPAPSTRDGEQEYLETYDPTRYGVDPTSSVGTADNIIFTDGEDGQLQVLLIERKNYPYKGYWCHPGGFIDAGESTKTAAVRELAEETSMQVDADLVLFVKRYAQPWRDPRMKYIVMNTHVAYFPTIPAFAAADDAADAKLVDVASLYAEDGLPLGFDHKQSIADAVQFLLN